MTMHTKNALVTMFEHNLWATLKLIDVCAALDPAKLGEKDPAVYGSIQETLVHIVNAERWYAWLLHGRPGGERVARLEGTLPLTGLRQYADMAAQDMITLAKRAADLPDAIGKDDKGQETPIPVAILLTQAIHHANEHRTNVTTMLAHVDVPDCDISGWAYLATLTGG